MLRITAAYPAANDTYDILYYYREHVPRGRLAHASIPGLKDMIASHLHSFGMSVTGRVRRDNEDAIVVLPEAGIYGVADGMGGVAGGAFASKTVMETVADAAARFESATSIDQRIAMLRSAINQASRSILYWAEQEGVSGTGTTAVLLLLDWHKIDQATVLHAGDSRAYLMRGGRLSQLTRDHSVAESYGEGGDEALPAVFRNVVTNAVGMSSAAQLEETRVSLRPGDILLLCSDGLYRMLGDDDIGITLSAPGSLKDRAEALVRFANEHGGKDNISVVLIDLQASTDAVATTTEQATSDTDVISAKLARAEPHHSSSTAVNFRNGGLSGLNDEIESTAPRSSAMTGDASTALDSRSRTLTFAMCVIAAAIFCLLTWFLVAERPLNRRHNDDARPANLTSHTAEVEARAPVPLYAAPVKVVPASASQPNPSNTSHERVQVLIERARKTGDWRFPISRLSELDPRQQSEMAESARAWMGECGRIDRLTGDIAAAELKAIQLAIEGLIHVWSPRYVAPAFEPLAINEPAFRRIFCSRRAMIQENLFVELEGYLKATRQIINACAGTSGSADVQRSNGLLSQDRDKSNAADRLKNIDRLSLGLQRWTERSRDYPIGIAEIKSVEATFATPLEQALASLLSDIGTAFGKEPALSSPETARPTVKTFHEAMSRYVECLASDAIHTPMERERLALLLKDLLSSHTLNDVLSSRTVNRGEP